MRYIISKILLVFMLLISIVVKSQIYPSFGNEINVSINGLSFDAMEPFISPDGNYLFFNNLNDGINTKLYYAQRLDDSTFSFIGELIGTNQIITPHLDAVADMDSSGNFYWISTRDYPAFLNNLFHGTFNAGTVTNIGRVYGNFYKNIPGWLEMDHGISYDGQFLYYNNARFDSICQGPCETELGVAQKVNDSTFNKIANSNIILQNIIDSNYIIYAPYISSDNLELYFTRYPKSTITANTLFEICVAVRTTSIGIFSVPKVLFSAYIVNLIEAPTLTKDKQVMYYHKRIAGSHKIMMRYRKKPVSMSGVYENKTLFYVYPNPTTHNITLEVNGTLSELAYSIENVLGQVVVEEHKVRNSINTINTASLVSGVYFVKVYRNDKEIEIIKFIKK